MISKKDIVEPEVIPVKSSRHFFSWIKTHKKRSIAGAFLLVLLLITAIPQTRYLLPGLFVHKDIRIIVQDTSGLNRIADADVEIDGQLFTSDQTGVVRAIGIRPGLRLVTVNKLFYKPLSQRVDIPLFGTKEVKLNIKSTGRPAKVTVKNRLSGRVLAGITVKTEQGSQAKTGVDGTAILILPSDKSSAKGTISGDGITTADVDIRAVQDDSTNILRATPFGRLYFLSKASGTVDVVRTNLDGSDRQTVLAGTGKEIESDTVLIASKDWKYLALKSRRDSDFAKLYLIETATDKLSAIDEGNATFAMIGWSGQTFAYTVDRSGLNLWSPKRQALKSFNAVSRKLVTIDETRAEGTSGYDYAYESLQSPSILNDQIVYNKTWFASYYYGTHLAGKNMSVVVIKSDGSGKKSLHDWPAGYYTYISSTLVSPNSIYYQVTVDGGIRSTWKYETGVVKEAKDLSVDDFNKAYPVYLESPNGKSSLWSEPRDGKNSLFIGDRDGMNSKEIASISEYVPYGWYTDDYILVSKKGSELYIMGRDGIKPGDVPTKVSDYHKPDFSYGGYGGI